MKLHWWAFQKSLISKIIFALVTRLPLFVRKYFFHETHPPTLMFIAFPPLLASWIAAKTIDERHVKNMSKTKVKVGLSPPKKTNISLEKCWLKDDFPFESWSLFRRASFIFTGGKNIETYWVPAQLLHANTIISLDKNLRRSSLGAWDLRNKQVKIWWVIWECWSNLDFVSRISTINWIIWEWYYVICNRDYISLSVQWYM